MKKKTFFSEDTPFLQNMKPENMKIWSFGMQNISWPPNSLGMDPR